MERLMCNFNYLGYYCSPNLSIHQNSTQELTWNFLVTLKKPFRNPLSSPKISNVIKPETYVWRNDKKIDGRASQTNLFKQDGIFLQIFQYPNALSM